MDFEPEKHHRHSIRVQGYDYNQGLFFLTLCTYQREHLFGEIVNNEIRLNRFGEIVLETWEWLSVKYTFVELDMCVVMPNHFHGILHLKGTDIEPSKPNLKTLGSIVGVLKTVSTKKINLIRNSPVTPIWQRNYYEHIVRNDNDLDRIREYIANNPATWETDLNNNWQK
ncbi:MAG: transposase [Chloroflexi bacterium]|uniref:Transposase n=1 Tax=Candidatus Chlorohelix allophototropha TaxID=3003348 RepID=A0A8T7M917_9CHLR|nr:transposase [Chloroflexota bacterium]WJW68539.1 transposase [Chloroflexota bacterium L227-S17]